MLLDKTTELTPEERVDRAFRYDTQPEKAEEFKKNPPKAPRTTPNKRKDVTPKNTQAIANKAKKNRNAGKQNRK